MKKFLGDQPQKISQLFRYRVEVMVSNLNPHPAADAYIIAVRNIAVI
jgi:hypothetical protein